MQIKKVIIQHDAISTTQHKAKRGGMVNHAALLHITTNIYSASASTGASFSL